ncbi:MAG: DUF2490 domain-containing protein [Muribaculaceae bacterium]|nr:DUF2490 domain-containing protein [Muribaculaceae bacterium]
MGGCEGKRLITCLLVLLCAACFPTLSLADDAGLVASVEASHKFSKKLSAGLETEFRSRNNFRTADRVSIGGDVSYKVLPWLKAAVGYELLIDNNKEKLTFQDDGVTYNNWRPSYWGTRHRFNFTLTASYKIQRVELSLRERWQYTYRPAKITDNFDFDEAMWEDDEVKGKGKNVLRSRFQIEWDIPKCKFDPFASVEFHTTRELEKTRFIVGVDHTLKKKHAFKFFYRYQLTGSGSDEANIHLLGLGYTYKF